MDDKNLIEMFNVVFGTWHSDGFKVAEMKDFLYDVEYRPIEKLNENWYYGLLKYCEHNNIDKSKFEVNPNLLALAKNKTQP
ncbi:hypothetical protein [Mesonia aquimarina]|uniref:hypothetical protein n=1 Tax=Mesonia aquimarina TaxID=1504967 RepID=UPI000EF5D264|nr:hypothetical protein [Mesonia aquimarina]